MTNPPSTAPDGATADSGVKVGLVACPSCGGSGWRKVFGARSPEDHALHREGPPIWLDCPTCGGAGGVTEAEFNALAERTP